MLKSSRRDILSAQKVEVGIVYQTMLGHVAAAEYLVTHGIPLHVALRVLLYPDRRRTFRPAPAPDDCGGRQQSTPFSF